MSLVTTLTGLNEKRFFNETVFFPFARIREPDLADQLAEIRANDPTAKLQILAVRSIRLALSRAKRRPIDISFRIAESGSIFVRS